MTLGVGIIGAGLIGMKRAASLGEAELIAVSDIDQARAKILADKYKVSDVSNWEKLIDRPDVNIVLVCTTNDALVPCAIAALKAGKHVLVEKPAGRNPIDLRQLQSVASKSKSILRVGFNHRFHPALSQAKQMVDSNVIGPLMYIRARYGHGGRVGYEKEWRANPSISGGGELIDQGVHLIDLCRWIGGDFRLGFGKASTYFWEMPVEDNAFLYLESVSKKHSAFLHASCTEWKNLFDFEIFGQTGKIEIWGLGRSYGTEELRYYRMKPEMGSPEIKITTFKDEDRSWDDEFGSFLKAIRGEKTDNGTLDDAIACVDIVYETYKNSGIKWAQTCNA